MLEYYLTHWHSHGQEDLIKIMAIDRDDLYNKLVIDFPDEEIKIQGYKGFGYITAISHFRAAGYPIIYPSISLNLAPAHFNRNFFYILTAYTVDD